MSFQLQFQSCNNPLCAWCKDWKLQPEDYTWSFSLFSEELQRNMKSLLNSRKHFCSFKQQAQRLSIGLISERGHWRLYSKRPSISRRPHASLYLWFLDYSCCFWIRIVPACFFIGKIVRILGCRKRNTLVIAAWDNDIIRIFQLVHCYGDIFKHAGCLIVICSRVLVAYDKSWKRKVVATVPTANAHLRTAEISSAM